MKYLPESPNSDTFIKYRRDRIARSGDPRPRGLLAHSNISRFVSYSIPRYFSLLYCHTTPGHWFTFHASPASVSRLIRTNRSLAKRLVVSIKTVQVARPTVRKSNSASHLFALTLFSPEGLNGPDGFSVPPRPSGPTQRYHRRFHGAFLRLLEAPTARGQSGGLYQHPTPHRHRHHMEVLPFDLNYAHSNEPNTAHE
jgi:hypothetical protein